MSTVLPQTCSLTDLGLLDYFKTLQDLPKGTLFLIIFSYKYHKLIKKLITKFATKNRISQHLKKSFDAQFYTFQI